MLLNQYFKLKSTSDCPYYLSDTWEQLSKEELRYEEGFRGTVWLLWQQVDVDETVAQHRESEP